MQFTDEIENDEEVGNKESTTDPSAGHGADDDDGSNGDGRDDVGTCGGWSGAGGIEMGDWRFIGESQFIHATLDLDQGAPHSQRETRSGRCQSISIPVDDGSHISVNSNYNYLAR